MHGYVRSCAHCRLEDAIAAKQDDIARLHAKQAMSEKALDLEAAQVADLKEALKDQADTLESSEAARDALKVAPVPRSVNPAHETLQFMACKIQTCCFLIKTHAEHSACATIPVDQVVLYRRAESGRDLQRMVPS